MAASSEAPWALREGIDDPAHFQDVWLGRKIWGKQKEIARAIQKYPLVAVKGCHASGKTYVASGFPLHHLIAHKHCKAFITAPTLRQVQTFWEEINLARAGGRCAQLLPEPNLTSLRIAPDRYATGASSSRGVNVQGLHSPNVLIICDEAPGIGADIWGAIEGFRAGGNVHVLKMGNPVVPSGAFYDAFTKEKAFHCCISISAFDTPNLQHADGRPVTIEELLEMDDEALDYAPYPYLISRRWVKERYLVWGPNHPSYRSRVLAEFPSDDPCGVFPLSWIERAQRDPTPVELRMAERCSIQVGIDVAGAGKDETVLTARAGGIILEQHAWPDPDPRGQVMQVLKQLQQHPIYRMGVTVVDITGIGYNFALHLADQGIEVFGLNAGARPVDVEQFVNQKAETHFAFRDALREDQVSGLTDKECAAQLSTLRYRLTSRGLVEIESKEQRNQRGIPGSPDRAESLIMSFMMVVPRVQQEIVGSGATYQISPI